MILKNMKVASFMCVQGWPGGNGVLGRLLLMVERALPAKVVLKAETGRKAK